MNKYILFNNYFGCYFTNQKIQIKLKEKLSEIKKKEETD